MLIPSIWIGIQVDQVPERPAGQRPRLAQAKLIRGCCQLCHSTMQAWVAPAGDDAALVGSTTKRGDLMGNNRVPSSMDQRGRQEKNGCTVAVG